MQPSDEEMEKGVRVGLGGDGIVLVRDISCNSSPLFSPNSNFLFACLASLLSLESASALSLTCHEARRGLSSVPTSLFVPAILGFVGETSLPSVNVQRPRMAPGFSSSGLQAAPIPSLSSTPEDPPPLFSVPSTDVSTVGEASRAGLGGLLRLDKMGAESSLWELIGLPSLRARFSQLKSPGDQYQK